MAGKTARKPRDGESSRLRILDAAEKEFAAKGFDGARLAAVAKGAKLKPGLIHFHFEDKAGLYGAVLERAFAVLRQRVGMLLALDLSTAKHSREELRMLGEGLVHVTANFYAEHGHVLALLRHEAASGSAVAKRMAAKHMKPVFDAVIERMERLQEQGVIARELDARHLFVSIVSMTAYPVMEPLFVSTIWPDGPRGEELEAARRSEVVATALARMFPRN